MAHPFSGCPTLAVNASRSDLAVRSEVPVSFRALLPHRASFAPSEPDAVPKFISMMDSTVCCEWHALEVVERVVLLVSVAMMYIRAGWYRAVRLFPDKAMHVYTPALVDDFVVAGAGRVPLSAWVAARFPPRAPGLASCAVAWFAQSLNEVSRIPFEVPVLARARLVLVAPWTTTEGFGCHALYHAVHQ